MPHRRHCLYRNIRIKLPVFAPWENSTSLRSMLASFVREGAAKLCGYVPV